MEKRIELEKRGKSPAAIKELNLDNCRATQIIGLTDEYVNLESLSLINVGLITLKGFPKLPNLRKLELSDNRISGGLHWLHGSPKLTYLNLSGNKIKDIETLKPLEEFKNLENLDLFTCEVTNVENYRDEVFGLVKSLKYLDGYDKDDKEQDESEDEDGNEDDEENDAHEDGESEDEDEEEGEDEPDEDEVNVDDEDDEDDIDDEDEDEDSEGNEFNEEVDEDEEEDADAPRGQKRKRDGEEGEDD